MAKKVFTQKFVIKYLGFHGERFFSFFSQCLLPSVLKQTLSVAFRKETLLE